MDERIALEPWLPWPVLMGLAALAVAAPLWTYRASGRVEDRRLRHTLVGLRAAALLALLALFTRPIGIAVEETSDRSQLVVLVDRSRSMRTPDAPGGMRRDEAANGLLRAEKPLLDELAKLFAFEVCGFGETLEDGPLRPEAHADATGIGPALEDVWRRKRTGRLAAVVLVTDGIHNKGVAPRDAARPYVQARTPIHAIVVGSSRPTAAMRDLALTDLGAPASVDQGNSFEARATIEATAANGQAIKVTCKFGGQLVGIKHVVAASDRHAEVVSFDVPARTKGVFPLEVEVAPVPGEPTHNNALRTEVSVTSRKLQVLLLEGAMRWEATFLRRALAEDPAISLVVGYAQDPLTQAELARPGVLEGMDVVIVGDVPFAHVPPRLAASLPDLVARREDAAVSGRGLLLTGGSRALSGGGWQRSPIAALLPVVLADAPAFAEGELAAVPTHEGQAHYALQLAKDRAESIALWARMPPLLDAERPARTKPTASVLLRAGEIGLLTTAAYGRGRVGVLASASTWRWSMSDVPDVRRAHRLFWRQLVLWLAGRDDAEQGRMWLSVDPSQGLFLRGDSVAIRLHAVDGRWQPLPTATVALTCEAPGGAGGAPLALAWDEAIGAFVAKLDLERVGEYRFAATAEHGGKPLGEDALVLSVRQRDPIETAHTNARPDELAALAQRTRGRMVELAGAPALLRSLRELATTQPQRFERRRELWDKDWVLFVLALLLGAEWLLRKRAGLS